MLRSRSIKRGQYETVFGNSGWIFNTVRNSFAQMMCCSLANLLGSYVSDSPAIGD